MIDNLLRRLFPNSQQEGVSHIVGATFSERWDQLEPYPGNWVAFTQSDMFYGKQLERVLKKATGPSDPHPLIFYVDPADYDGSFHIRI